jgi:hypothetical protein
MPSAQEVQAAVHDLVVEEAKVRCACDSQRWDHRCSLADAHAVRSL